MERATSFGTLGGVPTAIQSTRDSKYVVVGTERGLVVFLTATGRIVAAEDFKYGVAKIVCSEIDAEEMLVVSGNGDVRYVFIDERGDSVTLAEDTEQIFPNAIDLSWRGRDSVMAMGTWDDGLALRWPLQMSTRHVGPDECAHCVACAPHGPVVAAGSSKNGKVTLWCADTYECVATLVAHSGCIIALEFSHTGQTLASASENDMFVCVWRVADSASASLQHTIDMRSHLSRQSPGMLLLTFYKEDAVAVAALDSDTVYVVDTLRKNTLLSVTSAYSSQRDVDCVTALAFLRDRNALYFACSNSKRLFYVDLRDTPER